MSKQTLLSATPVVCPQFLLDKARATPTSTIAVVNAGSLLAMQSAKLIHENSLAAPVLVGDKSAIKSIADNIDWDISSLRLVDKASDLEAAAASVELARSGEVQSLMKGDIHTDDLLRAVLNRERGLTVGQRLSHVFHMTKPGSDEAICITDAVINVAPSVEAKLQIAQNAVSLCHALGIGKPKVAVLSASEVPSAAMPSSLDAQQVSEQAAQGAVTGAEVYGPLAFDNAVSREAAKLKGITNPVAGNADVLLVPNIETGNALFKQMVYYMSAAAGGIVLGAKTPIVLTSRADPAAARLAGAALAVIVGMAK